MMVMLVYVMPWGLLEGTYRRIVGFFWLGEVDERAKCLIDIADRGKCSFLSDKRISAIDVGDANLVYDCNNTAIYPNASISEKET